MSGLGTLLALDLSTPVLGVPLATIIVIYLLYVLVEQGKGNQRTRPRLSSRDIWWTVLISVGGFVLIFLLIYVGVKATNRASAPTLKAEVRWKEQWSSDDDVKLEPTIDVSCQTGEGYLAKVEQANSATGPWQSIDQYQEVRNLGLGATYHFRAYTYDPSNDWFSKWSSSYTRTSIGVPTASQVETKRAELLAKRRHEIRREEGLRKGEKCATALGWQKVKAGFYGTGLTDAGNPKPYAFTISAYHQKDVLYGFYLSSENWGKGIFQIEISHLGIRDSESEQETKLFNWISDPAKCKIDREYTAKIKGLTLEDLRPGECRELVSQLISCFSQALESGPQTTQPWK